MSDLRKTDAEWKAILTPEQYHIARENGTEAPHSGVHNLRMDEGSYSCVCCKTKLFESDSKFVPRCGWPSFTEALPDTIVYKKDNSIPGRPRTEVRCKACDAHLGHVFDDGPEPTGKRYCINSISIDFNKK